MATRSHSSAVMLTVDLAILTIRAGELHVLLVERGNKPYLGRLALPGGFVADGESLEIAARRELKEETNLDAGSLFLEQLRTYADPRRDPRGRVVSVAYLAVAPDLPMPVGGSDARSAQWAPVDDVLSGKLRLAFDHDQIVRDAVERARGKLEYSSLATAFCADTFTIADLRRVYEAVWDVRLDPGNFSRKVTKTAGFVLPTGSRRSADAGRPAALYRRGEAVMLYPPMLRSTVADH